MDFAVSPAIIDAIQRRAAHPLFGYNFELPAFRKAIDFWQYKRHGWDCTPLHHAILPSLMTALAYSILSLTRPNDAILIQSPVYPPFHGSVITHGRRLLINPLVNGNGVYSIDFEDFEAKAREAKLFILCNPHNPVGRVFMEAELERMAAICKKYNVMIFSDEIHADIIYPPFKHLPMAPFAPQLTITGISPAKTFNLAGLATAAVISDNQDYIRQIDKLNRDLHTFMGNSFGIAAFIAAFTEGESWLEELLVYLQANRDFLTQELSRLFPRLIISPIEGTFLMWLDFRAYGLPESELIRLIKDCAGLAFKTGSSFGIEGEGFVRLNFACPRVTLNEALLRLKKLKQHLPD